MVKINTIQSNTKDYNFTGFMKCPRCGLVNKIILNDTLGDLHTMHCGVCGSMFKISRKRRIAMSLTDHYEFVLTGIYEKIKIDNSEALFQEGVLVECPNCAEIQPFYSENRYIRCLNCWLKITISDCDPIPIMAKEFGNTAHRGRGKWKY